MTVNICKTELDFSSGHYQAIYLRDQPVRGVAADMLPGEFPRACGSERDLIRRMLSLHAGYPQHMSLVMQADVVLPFVEEEECYDY